MYLIVNQDSTTRHSIMSNLAFLLSSTLLQLIAEKLFRVSKHTTDTHFLYSLSKYNSEHKFMAYIQNIS